ncbi:MAG: hypothetical protein QNJ71_10715 [Acidimicrobiia bacterium]|nr:hypothetical protein [Acidimicrobiia bacterium]
MSDRDTLGLVLELRDLSELFEARPVDPLAEAYPAHGDVSGVDYILDQFRAHPSYKSIALTIDLPDVGDAPNAARTAEAALRRWSNAQALHVDADIASTRWQGSRTLVVAVIALFGFIGLSRLLASDDNLALQILSEGLSIAGWVALWFPLEVLMFSVWQHRLDRRALDRLAHASVIVRSQSAPIRDE